MLFALSSKLLLFPILLILSVFRLRQIIDASEDTNTVVKGEGRGRDEAKKNAALLACKMIDEQEDDYGSSEFKTKRQKYEENDYYGSDEDEFLDRTGSLEKKRKMRKERYQNDGKPEILTYELLVKQLEEATENLDNVKRLYSEAVEESKATKSLSVSFYGRNIFNHIFIGKIHTFFFETEIEYC